MFNDDKVKNARHCFMLASEDFGFEFMSPFTLTDEIEAFVLKLGLVFKRNAQLNGCAFLVFIKQNPNGDSNSVF